MTIPQGGSQGGSGITTANDNANPSAVHSSHKGTLSRGTAPHIYGANASIWRRLADTYLLPDLLPVVSNPNAAISPLSRMQALGKTPSWYNSEGNASGVAQWTSRMTERGEVERWAKEPDYGICIQTRQLRALDVDVDNPVASSLIQDVILEFFGKEVDEALHLPVRMRANSGKLLIPFRYDGELFKRKFTCHMGGLVEMLATGQQFVAYGTHTSGVKYEWQGAPELAPVLTLEELDELWGELVSRFAVPDSEKRGRRSTDGGGVHRPDIADPIYQYLERTGSVIDFDDKKGHAHIVCPFEEEHSTHTLTSTTYMLAGSHGHDSGHFSCLHASCAGRVDGDFLNACGYTAAGFDEEVAQLSIDELLPPAVTNRFKLLTDDELGALPAIQWLVRGVLPSSGIGAIFGPSGSGKSFLTLDLLASIACGSEWFGNRVKAAPVLYIGLEGEAGIAQRVKARRSEHGPASRVRYLLTPLDIRTRSDRTALVDAIKSAGWDGGVLCIDTLNRAAPGIDENDSQHMGEVIGGAKALQAALGGLVLLVHHTGKDSTKGLRGHSSLLAALDCAIEVSRDDDRRAWRVFKSKDGEDGMSHPFTLQTVELGEDDDGEPITSCVVRPEESIGAALRRPLPPKAGNQRVIWDALGELFAAVDISAQPDAPDDLPFGKPGVRLEDAIEKTRTRLVCERKRQTERARVAITGLVNRGLLAHREGWIWCA